MQAVREQSAVKIRIYMIQWMPGVAGAGTATVAAEKLPVPVVPARVWSLVSKYRSTASKGLNPAPDTVTDPRGQT